MTILYEDDCIIVCIKPAGIATQAAKVTEKDMVSEVNNYNKRAGGNPAYLIHRLDKPVGGILLFAKDKNSAGFLNDAIKNGEIEKRYYALVEGEITEKTGELNNFIYKDPKTKKAVITDGKTHDSKAAKLKYSVVDDDKAADVLTDMSVFGDGFPDTDNTLLDIELITGRYHQIRAQLSHIGHPVVNDTLYGAVPAGNNNRIALTAYKLTFPHPETKEKISLSVSAP